MSTSPNAPRTIHVALAGRAYDIAIGPGLIDRADCLTALMRIDAAEPDDDEPRSMQ